MKDLRKLDGYRDVAFELEFVGSLGGAYTGVFLVPSCTDKGAIKVIASAVLEWDHVSISRRDRVPDWAEMCQIKELFFEENETAMQLHPPRSEWINNHPTCLHLWRPTDVEIPRPPGELVGVKDMKPEDVARMSNEERRKLVQGMNEKYFQEQGV